MLGKKSVATFLISLPSLKISDGPDTWVCSVLYTMTLLENKM